MKLGGIWSKRKKSSGLEIGGQQAIPRCSQSAGDHTEPAPFWSWPAQLPCHGSLQETGILPLVWEVEPDTEGSARRRVQPWSPAFLQDAVRWSSRAVLTRNLWARTPWFSVSIFFFFFSPSTYLCGKISAFITDNLFRLPSGCSMLTLKELDLDCGGRRGAFKNLNLCFMARKVCVCGCFFFFLGSVTMTRREAAWPDLRRPGPCLAALAVDTACEGPVPFPLPRSFPRKWTRAQVSGEVEISTLGKWK